MAIKCEMTTVTPELAAKWLKKKAGNRKLKQKLIERYAKDMKSKRWQANGETIILSSTGELLDGQHRLEACILSHAPFETMVVSGVEDKAFPTMNIGSSRSNADVLSIKGESNANTLAAAARLMYFYDSGLDNPIGRGSWATPQDILKTLNQHPYLRESVGWCLQAYRIVPVSALAFMHCLASERGMELEADKLVEQITNGEDLKRGDPALTLRNKFLADRVLRHHELKPIAKLSFVVKAFNAFMAGETLSHLYWRESEEFPEIFPNLVHAKKLA